MGIAWPSTLTQPSESSFFVEDRNLVNQAAMDLRIQAADRGQAWRGIVHWNNLDLDEARAIRAHLSRARSHLFPVEIPIFEYTAMLGGQTVNLTMSGAHTAGSTTLTTTGFTGVSPFLEPGDLLRIAHNGERWIYEVVQQVTGGTTVNINPPTRHDYADLKTISVIASGAEMHLSCFVPGGIGAAPRIVAQQPVVSGFTVEFIEALREDLLV